MTDPTTTSPAAPAPPVRTEGHLREVPPKESFILGIGFAWDLGYTIAVPAVLFGIAGRWVDKQYGLTPLCLLAGLLLAFVISFTIIARKLKYILARMPKDLPRKKKQPEHVEETLSHEQQVLHDLFRPPKAK